MQSTLQKQVQSLEKFNEQLIQNSKSEVIDEIVKEQKKEVDNKEKEVIQLKEHIAELMEDLDNHEHQSNL